MWRIDECWRANCKPGLFILAEIYAFYQNGQVHMAEADQWLNPTKLRTYPEVINIVRKLERTMVIATINDELLIHALLRGLV